MSEEPIRPAPIAFTVVRYRCPACDKTLSAPGPMRLHIARCWYLAANHGCKTCLYFRRATPEDQCTAPIGGGPLAKLVVGCLLWAADKHHRTDRSTDMGKDKNDDQAVADAARDRIDQIHKDKIDAEVAEADRRAGR